MTLNSILRYAFRAILPGLITVLGAHCSVAAMAQETRFISTDAKLLTRVRLPLGATTLEKVTSELSIQTGLAIEPAPYLRQRRLVVNIDDMTAGDVLNTLAELNDYKWRETDKEHIQLARPTIHTPERVGDIPVTLQAVLPRDIRRYLGIGIPWSEILRKPDPKYGISRFNSEETVRSQLVGPKSQEIRDQLLKLFESLKPDVLSGKPISFAELTSQQQEQLKMATILRWLENMNGGTMFDIAQNRLSPYQVDIANADIHMEKKTLFIGTTTVKGDIYNFTGFGNWIETAQEAPESAVLSQPNDK